MSLVRHFPDSDQSLNLGLLATHMECPQTTLKASRLETTGRKNQSGQDNIAMTHVTQR